MYKLLLPKYIKYVFIRRRNFQKRTIMNTGNQILLTLSNFSRHTFTRRKSPSSHKIIKVLTVFWSLGGLRVLQSFSVSSVSTRLNTLILTGSRDRGLKPHNVLPPNSTFAFQKRNPLVYSPTSTAFFFV